MHVSEYWERQKWDWDSTEYTGVSLQIGDNKFTTAKFINNRLSLSLAELERTHLFSSHYNSFGGPAVFSNDMIRSFYSTMTIKDEKGVDHILVRDFLESRGYDESIISYWTDSLIRNFVLQPEMQDGPLSVVRKNNTVFIDLYYIIKGDAADLNYNGVLSHLHGEGPYRDFVAQGFKLWEDTYFVDGQEINAYVNLHEKAESHKKTQKYFTIDISRKSGTPSVSLGLFRNWAYSYPGNMTIRTGIKDNDDLEPDYVMIDAAHELGHILGLGDAYDVVKNRWAPRSREDNYNRSMLQNIADYGFNIFSLHGKDVKQNYLFRGAPLNSVPKNDIMRGGDEISDFTFKLVLDGIKTNEMRHYPKR
ncbi:UNVERIFIED_CONTAM: hypothetical protein Cloal_0995 [Acetivibrio alkalicellulosi]